MRLLGIVVVLLLSLLVATVPARAAETTGAYVCGEVDEEGACVSFVPVLEHVFEMDTATPGIWVAAAAALVLGLWLLGLGIGAVWRFLDAALGGPLS